jgi:hypothetical protein
MLRKYANRQKQIQVSLSCYTLQTGTDVSKKLNVIFRVKQLKKEMKVMHPFERSVII